MRIDVGRACVKSELRLSLWVREVKKSFLILSSLTILQLSSKTECDASVRRTGWIASGREAIHICHCAMPWAAQNFREVSNRLAESSR